MPQPSWIANFKISIPCLKKKGVGHAVHGIEHIVVCSIIFEKAEAVQEYERKEDKKTKTSTESNNSKEKKISPSKIHKSFSIK